MSSKLEVHQGNPRYFKDNSEKIVYLTGAHTWATVQDYGEVNPPPEFDYDGYLTFLKNHNHNFLRLWIWEGCEVYDSRELDPLIYCRPGPGTALDGKPKFDLNQLNQNYFDRLLDRVTKAKNQGIYVGVMFFQGWSVASGPNPASRWARHPCHPSNNINGIDGGHSQIHTMSSPVMAYQKTYIDKVITTLQNLDNVIWEIGNEMLPSSRDFQYHMIDYIRSQDSMNRMVGMTSYYGTGNSDLFNSAAEWISAGQEAGYDYKINPPTATGSKVIILDTDHIFGIGGDVTWVWKVFTRGHNIIFMCHHVPQPEWEPSRNAMGDTLTFANKMDLANMPPRGDLTSTGYALANPGEEYLVFQPGSGSFNVDLAPGTYDVEWFNPRDRTYHDGGTVG
jgi:hypothetical protein